MLQLKKITGNKKIYLDLLLLADPEEKAIDKYINDSEIFSLIENEKVLGQCAVTKIDKYRCEIKNFFINNYDEEIFDNGIQCIDMIYLEKKIK